MKSKMIGRNRDTESKFHELLESNLEEQSRVRPGAPALLTVTEINDAEFVFVKSEFGTGMIDKKELLDQEGKVTVAIGEKLHGFLHSLRHGENIFTTKPTGPIRDTVLQNALEAKTPLRGRIVRAVKGGYEVQFGEALAFCPASRMEEKNPQPGSTLTFLIVELSGRRVIVSRRDYLDIEREKRKIDLQSTLHEGDVVTGTVTTLQNFGAFVDLGGMEGLIPLSEISYRRIHHPKEELKSGQEVRVKVLQTDWKENRITLSLRALQENPWQGEMPFDRGQIVEGIVDGVKPFGIFVRLPDHFQGLISNAESGVERGQKMDRHYQKGQKVRVMILSIDREREKISLSAREVRDADIRQEYEEYMGRMNSDGESGNISSFGRQLLASLDQDGDEQKKDQS